MNLASTSCPQCMYTTLRRSRRRLYDWPAYAFGLKPVRCVSCGLRFYTSPARLDEAQRARSLV